MTKSMARNVVEASELTAVRQVATAANYKADVVQHQLGDLQKQVTGMQDQLNRMEALLQRIVKSQRRAPEQTLGRGAPKLRQAEEPSNWQDLAQSGELEVVMARRTEDMGQININSTRGVQLHGIPEVNFNSPSTGYSAVPNGWGQSQLPHAFVASPTLNNLNPNSEPDLARQWHLNPREYLNQPQFKYHARQWNPNPSNDRAHSFYKSLAKGPKLDVPDEAQFDLAQLYMVGRADSRLRCTGLFWKPPPWPDFCAMICDRFAQHSGYEVLVNFHSVKQYNHSVLDNTNKFEELMAVYKSESMKMRHEVEEERKMLQMAEVWREERVQIKLVDAKLTLDSKYSQLNKLQSDLEDFLSFHRGNSVDKESVRDAEKLREAICSMKFYDIKEFSHKPPPPSEDIFAVFEELRQREGTNEKEIGQCKGDSPSIKLWAKRDLPTQHILLRRRIVVFNTMGLMEVVFNRPVDILRKLFDGNTLRSQIEEFFNRYGAGEAAAMCLMLAAKLLYAEDSLISNADSEKAAEAFEDPGLVGMSQIDGTTALSNTRTQAGGFSMGQVVQEAKPLFSSAYKGLFLCSSRLLYPIWELPVMVVRGLIGSSDRGEGVVVCRLFTRAMKVLESKIRSLETFLRSGRNKRRGLYGYVAGLGDSGSILYKTGPIIGSGVFINEKSPYSFRIRDMGSAAQTTSNKKRRLLRRSGEALSLLQLICRHNVARLVQLLPLIQLLEATEISVYDYFVKSRGIELRYSGDLQCVLNHRS